MAAVSTRLACGHGLPMRVGKRCVACENEKLRRAVDLAVGSLCEFAEEQPGNPHDLVSERLYAIAHALELRETE